MRRLLLSVAALSIAGAVGWGQAPPTPQLEQLDRTRTLPGIHKKLIGQEHCTKCHDATQRANDQKCLDCHKEIQATIERGYGYHYTVVRREGQICETCHKEHSGEAFKLTVWTDEAGMRDFDHRKTDYPLEGAHGKIECRKCHTPEKMVRTVTQRTRVQESFLGLGTRCVDCHKDVHQARLGTQCDRCHTLEKWTVLVPDAPFDHAKTRYPLEGKHAQIDDCKKCHTTGRMMDPVPHEACRDCHKDEHQGQFADRADKGRCEACHDVQGFVPPLYGLKEHQESRFPLNGGHRAVACNRCHVTAEIQGVETARFDFPSRECEACHTQPPTGHIVQIDARYACKDCHVESRWQEVRFDHGRSKFELTGKHRDVACLKCHTTDRAGTPQALVRWVELRTDCAGCHEDIHYAQFAQQKCDDCHVTDNWEPSRFDHQRNSDYALAGKHKDVKCHGCHRLEVAPDGRQFRRYKPLSTDCRSCHGADGSVLSIFGLTPGGRGIQRP